MVFLGRVRKYVFFDEFFQVFSAFHYVHTKYKLHFLQIIICKYFDRQIFVNRIASSTFDLLTVTLKLTFTKLEYKLQFQTKPTGAKQKIR